MRRHQEAAKAALAQMEDDDDIASESDLSGDEEPLEEGEEGISDDSADLMQGVTHHGDGSLSEGDEDDLDEDDGDVDDGEEDEPMQQKPPAGVPSARRPLAASADAAEAREQQDLLHPGAGQHSLDAALLQLQVSELLKEVRLSMSPSLAEELTHDLVALRDALYAMQPQQVSGDQAAGFIRELGLDPQGVTLPFLAPSLVTPLGSWVTHSMVRSSRSPPSLDIAVVIPEACLFKKAHLDYRYHARRALYLATIAAHLSGQSLSAAATQQHQQKRKQKTQAAAATAAAPFAGRALQLHALQQDPSRPVLVISGPLQPGTQHPSYLLRVIPVVSSTTFPFARLNPDRNGVRWVVSDTSKKGTLNPRDDPVARSSGQEASTSAPAATQPAKGGQQQQQPQVDGASASQPRPTPQYNTGVLSDMTALLHALLLHRTFADMPHLPDALLLLKVWAHQHGLSTEQTADGLGGHLLAMLLVHLATKGKLSPTMTALQILRAALNALADPAGGLGKGMAMTPATSDALRTQLTPSASSLFALLSHPAMHASTSAHPRPPSQKAAAHHPGHASQLLDAALSGLPAPSTAPPLQLFRKHHPAVLIDPTGFCNLAAHMTKSSAALVQSCAKATLLVLESPLDPEASFRAAFLTPTSPLVSHFDYTWAVGVRAGAAVQQAASTHPPAHARAPQGATEPGSEGEAGSALDPIHRLCWEACLWRRQESEVESLVARALGDRAALVRAVRRHVPACSLAHLAQGLPPVAGSTAVVITARVDATAALRLVDVGPAADDAAAAAKFRAFWGPVSELRRFQDGRICEAAVWGAGPGSRHTILDRIVSYAVRRHKPGGATGSVSCHAGALDPALWGSQDWGDSLLAAAAARTSHEGRLQLAAAEAGDSGSVDSSSSPNDEAVVSTRLLEGALDRLGKLLRGLEGLALKVVGVQPLSPASRGTAPFPPRPHPLAGAGAQAQQQLLLAAEGGSKGESNVARCLEPQEVMVQMESTGRWPSNPVAFAKMRAALGVQLAGALEKAHGLTCQVTETAIDVLSEGFAFRLLLYSGREELAVSATKPPPPLPSRPAGQQQQQQSTAALLAAAASAAAAAQLAPELPTLSRSWHAGLVSGVAGENPSFAPAARLAARWVAAHCLSGALSQEAVELLVVAAYTSPGPAPPPASRTAGFLRFLQVLSSHPWGVTPLVVDPTRQLSQAEVREVLRRADARRAAAGGIPNPPMALATPRDLDSAHWTAASPSADVLAHIVATARATLASAATLLPFAPPPATSHACNPAAGGASGKSTGAGQAVSQDIVQQPLQQAALLGAVFSPRWDQSAADLVVCLRKEGLPGADHALPAPLALPAGAVSAAGSKARKRSHAETSAAVALARGAGRQPDALTHELDEWGGEGEPPHPAKRARAFLHCFPLKALEGRTPEALRSELLVGVDPASRLASALRSALNGPPPASTASASAAGDANGNAAAAGANGTSVAPVVGAAGAATRAPPTPAPLATVCVDGQGGSLLGLKWTAAAFMPQEAEVGLGHAYLPCITTHLLPHAGGAGSQRSGMPLCVPNVVQLLREVSALGAGLVDDVAGIPGCGLLPAPAAAARVSHS